MTTTELHTQMVTLWEEFSTEQAKTAKAAHKRARKSLSALKKLISQYNKTSVIEDKTAE